MIGENCDEIRPKNPLIGFPKNFLWAIFFLVEARFSFLKGKSAWFSALYQQKSDPRGVARYLFYKVNTFFGEIQISHFFTLCQNGFISWHLSTIPSSKTNQSAFSKQSVAEKTGKKNVTIFHTFEFKNEVNPKSQIRNFRIHFYFTHSYECLTNVLQNYSATIV